jgi:hypothetical protein
MQTFSSNCQFVLLGLLCNLWLFAAGFLWLEKPATKKLSRKSAQFVDVIHSAGGDFIGTDKPV